MTVERILNSKGRDVFTVQPHRTVGETSKMLADHKIGAVVVTGANGEVIGMVSERDIVRALAHRGADAIDDPVSRHMTTRVFTVSEALSIDTLMDEMTTGRHRHTPVVQDGRLRGIVSIGDVVKHRIADFEYDNNALHRYIHSV